MYDVPWLSDNVLTGDAANVHVIADWSRGGLTSHVAGHMTACSSFTRRCTARIASAVCEGYVIGRLMIMMVMTAF